MNLIHQDQHIVSFIKASIDEVSEIYGFNGPFYFLHNHFVCDVEFGGVEFRSVEHAYHASMDIENEAYVSEILDTMPPQRIEFIARKINVDSLWIERQGIANMEVCLRSKFSDPALADLLVHTGSLDITYANSRGDILWGIDTMDGTGRNELGKMLMRIRQSLR